MKMRLARAQHKNAKQQSGNADDKLLGEFAEGMYLLVYKCAAKHNEYNIRNIHNSVLEMNDGNIQYIITGDWLAQHCIFGRGELPAKTSGQRTLLARDRGDCREG